MLKVQKPSRKKQIEHKATDLFRQKGYAATSMRDLATSLGIEAASLYSHIKSKEEILRNICFRMAEQFFEAQNRINGQATATEKLRQAMVAHIVVITRDTAASAVFFNEWRHLSEPYLSEFTGMRDRYEGRFREIIREGIASGEFQPLDEKFAMLTLLSSLNWTYNWFKKDGKMTAEEVGQQLASLMINGFKNNKTY